MFQQFKSTVTSGYYLMKLFLEKKRQVMKESEKLHHSSTGTLGYQTITEKYKNKQEIKHFTITFNNNIQLRIITQVGMADMTGHMTGVVNLLIYFPANCSCCLKKLLSSKHKSISLHKNSVQKLDALVKLICNMVKTKKIILNELTPVGEKYLKKQYCLLLFHNINVLDKWQHSTYKNNAKCTNHE